MSTTPAYYPTAGQLRAAGLPVPRQFSDEEVFVPQHPRRWLGGASGSTAGELRHAGAYVPPYVPDGEQWPPVGLPVLAEADIALIVERTAQRVVEKFKSAGPDLTDLTTVEAGRLIGARRDRWLLHSLPRT